MRHLRPLLTGLLMALILAALPSAAQAQNPYNFTLALSGVFGGSSDADPDPGFDNFGLQGTFLMKTGTSTYFGVRLGQIGLEADDNGLFDSSLRYLTAAGEYRFSAGYYESSLFFGLGAYDLDGDLLVDDETAFGLTLGTSGEFRISQKFSLLVEFSGHWADMDYASVWVLGAAGIAYHF